MIPKRLSKKHNKTNYLLMTCSLIGRHAYRDTVATTYSL